MKNNTATSSIYKIFKKHTALKYCVPALIVVATFLLLSMSHAVAYSSSDAADSGKVPPGLNWAKNFGGPEQDSFTSVAVDGSNFVAVGVSAEDSFGTGSWAGISGKGNDDAAIVKYDSNGNVIWAKNFGGLGNDNFESVISVDGGYIAVGMSGANSFGNGNLTGVTGNGGNDAIMVKFDTNGSVVWAKNFGGKDNDQFTSVTAVGNGYVAVGYSGSASFGNGSLTGITGKGGEDAIMVKFDTNGSVVWVKNFGGKDDDRFTSVTADSSGYVAVGYSGQSSFGNGNWAGVSGKGNEDAIMVKFDVNGNILWNSSFGGKDDDQFTSVTTGDSGYVAIGTSGANSFGSGDWTGTYGMGGMDAIIVNFDSDGSVVWKNLFGWGNDDILYSITAFDGGYLATGSVQGVPASNIDAVLVRFDASGTVMWGKYFAGNGIDAFTSVVAAGDGYVVVGYSYLTSFGNGDWVNVTGHGNYDATIVEFGSNPSSNPGGNPSSNSGSSDSSIFVLVGIAAIIVVFCAVIAIAVMRGRRS